MALDTQHGVGAGSNWSLDEFLATQEDGLREVFNEIFRIRGPDFEIPEFAAYAIQKEYQQSFLTDKTLPTYNYLGPGTKTATNILKRIRGRNSLDETALHHDLDMYLTRDAQDISTSDRYAIQQSKINTSYWRQPVGKIALENMLNRGFGPVPDPNPELYDYLYSVHELDEYEIERESQLDDSMGGMYQNHGQTDLAKQYLQDKKNWLKSYDRTEYIDAVEDANDDFLGEYDDF